MEGSRLGKISTPPPVDHRPSDRGEETSSKLSPLSDSSSINEKHIERLSVNSAGCAHLLNVGEINWFGAAGNYVELHVGSRSYLLRRTMKDMEGFLDPSRFLRIHRATIVNSRRIEGFRVRAWGNYEVVLHDGVRLKETRGIPEKRSEFAVICHIPQSVLPLNRPIMKCTPIHLCAIVGRC